MVHQWFHINKFVGVPPESCLYLSKSKEELREALRVMGIEDDGPKLPLPLSSLKSVTLQQPESWNMVTTYLAQNPSPSVGIQVLLLFHFGKLSKCVALTSLPVHSL